MFFEFIPVPSVKVDKVIKTVGSELLHNSNSHNQENNSDHDINGVPDVFILNGQNQHDRPPCECSECPVKVLEAFFQIPLVGLVFFLLNCNFFEGACMLKPHKDSENPDFKNLVVTHTEAKQPANYLAAIQKPFQ